MPYMEMVHETDPRQDIYDKVGMVTLGDIPGFVLMGNRVLVAIYERPTKTKSGIHIPDQTRGEEEHQGKAGLVLMVGPTAFKSDANYDFGGLRFEPGDWVSCSPLDGRKQIIKGKLCRIFWDQDIAIGIPSPDVVF